MKASTFVAFAYGVGTVSAFGFRGAVERAMWYADYLAEEIFDEEDHTFKTAPGCVGTREGFRKQKNRCTLVEFLDHVWHSSSLPVQNKVPIGNGQFQYQDIGHKNDEKPTKAEATKGIGPKALNLQSSDVAKMGERINSFHTKVVFGTLDVAKPAGGYTGNLDMSKVYNGYGAGEFYRGLRDSGAYRKQVAEEIETRIAADEAKDPADQKMKNGMKNSLRKWAAEGKFGAQYDYELRLRDAREYELNPQKDGHNENRSISQLFGHPVETKIHEFPTERLANAPKLRGSYPEADREATAERWKDEFDGDIQKAREAFDTARDDFMNQDLEHKSALNSAEDNIHGTACPI